MYFFSILYSFNWATNELHVDPIYYTPYLFDGSRRLFISTIKHFLKENNGIQCVLQLYSSKCYADIELCGLNIYFFFFLMPINNWNGKWMDGFVLWCKSIIKSSICFDSGRSICVYILITLKCDAATTATDFTSSMRPWVLYFNRMQWYSMCKLNFSAYCKRNSMKRKSFVWKSF